MIHSALTTGFGTLGRLASWFGAGPSSPHQQTHIIYLGMDQRFSVLNGIPCSCVCNYSAAFILLEKMIIFWRVLNQVLCNQVRWSDSTMRYQTQPSHNRRAGCGLVCTLCSGIRLMAAQYMQPGAKDVDTRGNTDPKCVLLVVWKKYPRRRLFAIMITPG